MRDDAGLRLRLEPAAADTLRQSDWWRELGRGRGKRVCSVYYDTGTRLLRKLGLSLRVRVSNKRHIQTLRYTGHHYGPLMRREWETMLPGPVPDPALVDDPVLPAEYRALTAGDVHAVFDFDLRRDTRLLASDEAHIALALDQGDISAGKHSARVGEVKMKLLSGRPGSLFSEARRLNDSVSARLQMRPVSDIGYRLEGGGMTAWSKAANPRLTDAMSAGDALYAIIADCLQHLTANDDCARADSHIEGVHQCRVALRRLHSAFRIYKPVLEPSASARLVEEIRWLARLLGTARDLDVLRADLLEPARQALEVPGQTDLLLARLETLRKAAHADAAEALSSPRYGRLLIDLLEMARAGRLPAHSSATPGLAPHPALGMPVRDFALAVLTKMHERALKRGRGFAKLNTRQRHRLRLSIKELRYVAEFFGGLFGKRRRRKYSRRLTRLQDDLGRMNDVKVTARVLDRLIMAPAGTPARDKRDMLGDGGLAFAAGCVLGWHRRRAAETDAVLVRRWKRFAAAKPFW